MVYFFIRFYDLGFGIIYNMIKNKLLLLRVLSALLFTNFLFSQTSLDDFDFSELDSLIVDENVKYITIFNNVLTEFENAGTDITKNFALEHMAGLRDPRFMPIIVSFIDTCSSKYYVNEAIHTLSMFSDTTGHDVPFWPNEAYNFIIQNTVKEKLILLQNDSSLKIQTSSAHALFSFGFKKIAEEKFEELLSQGFADVLDGFYTRNIEMVYFGKNLDIPVNNLEAIPFVTKYLTHNSDIIRAKAATFFIELGDTSKSIPVAKDIIKNSSDLQAINHSKRILKLYEDYYKK